MHPRPLAIALLAIRFVIAVCGHPAAAQVEPFPAGFRTQRIATNGTTLYVRVGGKNPAATIALVSEFLAK